MRLQSPLAIILLLLLLCACAPKGPPQPRLDVSISEINAVRVGMMERYPFDYRGKIAGDQPE